MFGKIIEIQENVLIINNGLGEVKTNLMNCHLVFDEENRKIVGEIIYIDEKIIKILLVGEIKNNSFSAGVVRKPSGVTAARIIYKNELELIIGQANNKGQLTIGTSTIYNDFAISLTVNDFFANHSAIIGNTGSGKSCGVTRILQNLFFNREARAVNAHVVLFDAYGEYVKAFDKMNDIEGMNFKKYTTFVEETTEERLNYPAYFLDSDDLAVLLSLGDATQIPILEKTLKLVKVFKDNSPRALEYKNDIIAKCLLDILTSGNRPTQIRDQIIAVLSHYNTEELNLDATISQPGYNRTFRQCLLIDEQGKMNSILEVLNFLKKYEKTNVDGTYISQDMAYSLDDLYYALEFALISEGVINSDLSYEKNNIIKARLLSIINGDYKDIFNYSKYISKEDYIKEFFSTSSGENVQLVNINLSHVDDRFAKILTKLYSKLFFKFTTSLKPRGSYSINIVLEEAHRYVQNDNDINVIGYNVFDRITKEGRKYGVLLTFITQRPSELSMTALSQCSNFLVFRIFHPKDLEIVRNISTNVNSETIERLKSLNPGTAMVFGVGLKLPLLVQLDLPNPIPESSSLDIASNWYGGEIDG